MAVAASFVLALFCGAPMPSAQTDLDAFMRQVLDARDTNWKKLQQYVLDEREQFDLRGPTGAPLWGEQRDYTWYVRDGFFVRSPLRVNGAAVSETDRLAYEKTFLEREQRRETRAQASGATATERAPATDADAAPPDVDGLIRQSRQPQFISSAYFLRFQFDAGRYAFVGRERLDGRDVLRIEYYPEKLFTEERRRELRDELEGDRRRPPARDSKEERSYDAELRRLMNKSSKVTLWIEPTAHQIVKYTFDDLGWNFFPGQWLARVDGVTASMTMGQPFPDVWLPLGLEMQIGMQMAFGSVQLRYTLHYDNYRQADVQSKIGIPDRP
ncbi:MAG: hypothetical protein QM736_27845 [Vicinamibacterales bacterium]